MAMWLPDGIILDGVKLDRHQTKTLARQVYRSAFRSRRAKIAYVAAVAAAPLVPIVVLSIGIVPLVPRPFASVTGVVIGVTMSVLAAVVSKYGFFYVYRREIRRATLQFGYAICPDCGYWLKGLAESAERCPECGGPITSHSEQIP